MIDSLVQTISAAILSAGGTGVILYFVLKHTMKPIDAYLEEKGKNLATHEDIMKLVDQVRETERVKAEITDNVWDRQQRWTFKQSVYRELLEALNAAHHAVMDRTVAQEVYEKPYTPQQKESVLAATNKLLNCTMVLDKLTVVAGVVVSAEGYEVIKEIKSTNLSTSPNALEDADRLTRKMTYAARKDLGYEFIGLLKASPNPAKKLSS